MKNYVISTRQGVVTLFFCVLLLLAFIAQAQKLNQSSQIIRVKLTEEAASALEKRSFQTSRSGTLLTGLSRVDQVNEEYQVKSMRRMFRDAGKFEAKHRAHGLHLWYEIIYDKSTSRTASSASLSAVRSAYEALPDIQVAELILDKSIDYIDDFSANDYQAMTKRFSLENGSNDPLFSEQWHYNNTGQTGGKPGADISLLEAWTEETGSSEVIVAVTDWSLDVNHEDLKANMWVNQGEIPGNGIDDDNNGFVDDVNGYDFGNNRGELVPYNSHGIHVAGTVAGVSNNATGVAGIAGGSGSGDGVRLMSCGVFSDENRGGFAETYIYAADNGAVISQNSWNYTSAGAIEQSVLDAIDYFIAEAGYDENGNPSGPMQGGVVIFSAGNKGTDEEWWPGYYEPVVAVAATDHNDVRADFSNYGSWIDVSAPGVNVMSGFLDNEYNTASGTSMSCPHVSGVAALIVSKFAGNITPEEVKDRIVRSSDAVRSLAPGSGRGRLNAYFALQENDSTGPEAITDVEVISTSQTAVTMQWIAPADNGNVVEYDLRYSTSPINESNFDQAIQFENIPYPSPAGEVDTIEVAGLASGVTYYFAVKSVDFFGNVSAMSNVVTSTVLDAPIAIVTPDSVWVNAEEGQLVTVPIKIINDGQEPLNYSFAEISLARKQGLGGDLEYGYTWSDSEEPNGPEFVWNDISTSGTEIRPGNGIDLPFAFDFYGQEKTSVNVSVYGYLTFGNNLWDPESDPIPHQNDPNDVYKDPNDYIAPIWDRFSKGNIYYEVNEDRLIVQYNRTTTFTYWGDAFFTFQVVLTPSGNIYFYYKDLERPEGMLDNWVIYYGTVGIENADATDGVEVAFQDQILKEGLAIGIYKPIDMLSVSNLSGTVAVGDTAIVNVTVDARDVTNGSYSSSIVMNTNDPNKQEIIIPFEVEINGSSATAMSFGSSAKSSAEPVDIISEVTHYPNPTDNTSTLKYALRERQYVEIQIVNTKGQLVHPVSSGWEEAGNHQVTQDLKAVSSGLYMYKIIIGDKTYLSRLMVK
ncbi:S8 family serine peptidase [Fulvivirga sediminis]|uniref:S8 family serine peptidase n=1 Tax=Fulvivirga sediminis TaxID=2803949 RepID=A0A937FDC3_9BACT|nr:S8 family serine peptidase [Fulvivirga sediminis]MBL3658830.1 S8 family serine peptidase [Fulvivirga sediminis]